MDDDEKLALPKALQAAGVPGDIRLERLGFEDPLRPGRFLTCGFPGAWQSYGTLSPAVARTAASAEVNFHSVLNGARPRQRRGAVIDPTGRGRLIRGHWMTCCLLRNTCSPSTSCSVGTTPEAELARAAAPHLPRLG